MPSARRDLFDQYAGALAGWEWDVALLQEVPPWWPSAFSERLGVDQRMVLTSRNALLPARRAVAVRWPDLIKSNGGGCNAILVRDDSVAEHRWRRLCVWPERRWVHGVRLQGAGAWVANVHAGGALRDACRAAASALRWAGELSVAFGGDFNIQELTLDGFDYAGGHSVDHVFLRGLTRQGAVEVLDRGHLSDHAPVRVSVTTESAPAPEPRAKPSP